MLSIQLAFSVKGSGCYRARSRLLQLQPPVLQEALLFSVPLSPAAEKHIGPRKSSWLRRGARSRYSCPQDHLVRGQAGIQRHLEASEGPLRGLGESGRASRLLRLGAGLKRLAEMLVRREEQWSAHCWMLAPWLSSGAARAGHEKQRQQQQQQRRRRPPPDPQPPQPQPQQARRQQRQ